jgi:hypothetical protein
MVAHHRLITLKNEKGNGTYQTKNKKLLRTGNYPFHFSKACTHLPHLSKFGESANTCGSETTFS